MLVSIIIRTLNEETYLGELLEAVQNQEQTEFSVEVVIVDSGSTDRTLEIAESFGARITTIQKVTLPVDHLMSVVISPLGMSLCSSQVTAFPRITNGLPTL